ncbi:MAG: glycosyltransferase family 4 protein [Thermoproteota archaeon]
MKVAYYSPSAATTQVGGIETFVREVSARLCQAGVKVSIITGLGEISSDFRLFQASISNVYYLPFLRRYKICNDIICRFTARIGHELTPYALESYTMMPFGAFHFITHSYDIIAVHGFGDLFLRFCTGQTPFILHYQGGYVSPLHLSFLKRLPIFCIITCSNYLKKYLHYLGAECRIEWVHNGVDANLFKPDTSLRESTRNLLGIGNRKMMLYVGRFAPEKEVELAIHALALVRKNIEACLVLVGSGPLRSYYLELARKLGVLSNLIVVDSIPHNQLPSYYNAADLFILPSSREPFGIALVEAQACGLPVVAANSGGIPEVVKDGETGILFEAGLHEALASNLLTLLQSKTRMEDMGFKSRKNVLRAFTWEHTTRRILEIYSSAIKEL